MSWLSRNLAKLGVGDWVTENLPTADSASNDHVSDVVGNKTDTTSGNSLVSLVKVVDTNVDTILSNAPRRVERAASTLPQTAQAALFTVTGRVIVTQLVGEVTVEIGAGANNAILRSNPTVGAGDIDLCALLDIDGDVVGTMYNITGNFADAMVNVTYGAIRAQTYNTIVPAGSIDLACSASKAGQIKWTIHWIPLDAGSSVVAA